MHIVFFFFFHTTYWILEICEHMNEKMCFVYIMVLSVLRHICYPEILTFTQLMYNLWKIWAFSNPNIVTRPAMYLKGTQWYSESNKDVILRNIWTFEKLCRHCYFEMNTFSDMNFLSRHDRFCNNSTFIIISFLCYYFRIKKWITMHVKEGMWTIFFPPLQKSHVFFCFNIITRE